VTIQYADVNGIRIAYGVRGSGPPLVLIMGYRLSSLAWPLDFIEALAARFTVVLFDNRGTGASDKPTFGYEISNMARDVGGLLDHLEIGRANLLGYSMGGAIAQEFVRQFPDRVLALLLCATMCGGPRAVYASPSVVRVMRELEGLKPEEIARRIWSVTYSPGYLENHGELAEDQMRREITAPTPLHAADLQYQAFAEFDCSKALANIKTPTLVLTGDLDQLVSPQNSKFIASLIPGANLVVIPGCGHRMMWEATDECIGFITEFLTGVSEGRRDVLALPVAPGDDSALADFVDAGRSRGRYDDDRPAIDLFRRQRPVWRRQTNYPRPGFQQQFTFLDALELAQGSRLSPGDDGLLRQCRRPIGDRVDTRHYPARRQKGGAGSPRLRNAACIGNDRSPQGPGVRHRRPQRFIPP
jgi:pimeloyl-ACP methyl ester carboxylesterase